MENPVIKLGSLVCGQISGFKGIVTARLVHLHGCDRYWVQPAVCKDGKLVDGSWFDVQALKVITEPKEEP